MTVESVLLLASKGDEARRIADFCRWAFPKVTALHGDWGQPLPEDAQWWRGDLIVSYCSRWIVPRQVLESAEVAGINFHPGPPEYPGVGCLNWALYEGAAAYGVTCHHMLDKVDAGAIIEHRRFPVVPADTAETLFERTHLHLECLAKDVLALIAAGGDLPTDETPWAGTHRSRSELDALALISPEMADDEIGRRVRATAFGKWRPAVQVAGRRFELVRS